jgi:hypothetical protein
MNALDVVAARAGRAGIHTKNERVLDVRTDDGSYDSDFRSARDWAMFFFVPVTNRPVRLTRPKSRTWDLESHN